MWYAVTDPEIMFVPSKPENNNNKKHSAFTWQGQQLSRAFPILNHHLVWKHLEKHKVDVISIKGLGKKNSYLGI